MNFKNLTPALFAFILSVAPALAQNVANFNPISTTTTTQNVASKLSYRQWQTVNFIDKITYSQNEMVISYRYKNSGSATIYAPNEDLAWVLKDTKGNLYKVKSVKQLTNNGKLVSENLTEQTHVSSYTETANGEYTFEELNLTCELHFDRLPADVSQVDLVEGAGRETWSNHFNAFEIAIQQPKELKENETLVQNLEMIPHVETIDVYDYSFENPEGSEGMSYREESENNPFLYDENGELVLDENGQVVINTDIFHTELIEPVVEEWEFEAEPVEITVSAFELSEKIHTDKKPKSRQWQPEYTVTRIDYHEKEMVITFQNSSKNGLSSTFYGPQGESAWFLKDKNGNVYPMKALNNLKHNNNIVAEGVATQMHIGSDWDSKAEKETATCQIVFDRLPDGVTIVDLIEGVGRETWSNHFNVFDIKIKSFKTNPETPTDEPIVAPILVENTERPSGVDVAIVGSNYSLFPNPNKGTFFLTNNGKTQNDVTIQVLDLTGKLVYSQSAVTLQEKNSQSFQVANLPAGQYMLRVQHNDNSNETLRLVVIE
jgi:Secretion system C-terminal sorting domain